jgi:hypothetical protein
MMVKHEWKKNEKHLYLPKEKPELISIPKFKFISIQGKGNPNDAFFSAYIEVLYALSYAVKMSPKNGTAPPDYFDYTVYPLEGVWDIDDDAKKTYTGTLDKNALVFDLMIRQPDFVTKEYAQETIARTKIKKPLELLDKVIFGSIEEGRCVQMLHVGSYDSEPASFEKMMLFVNQQQLRRSCYTHREIYLSDARKVSPEKLRTVLRFRVES